jgi:malate dehydrogenase (oxaloacetate-decarboxylating)(NADP+)
VVRGEADAMICGVEGRYMTICATCARSSASFGRERFAALSLMITSKGAYFIADTQVRPNPSAEELAEMAALAAIHVQRFNISPRSPSCHIPTSAVMIPTSRKMRRATALLKQNHPEIEADGEMQGDTALSEAARKLILPHSKLQGRPIS